MVYRGVQRQSASQKASRLGRQVLGVPDAPEEEVKREAKRRARDVKQAAHRFTEGANLAARAAKRDAKETRRALERRIGKATYRSGSSWVERLARLGYATKGVVYALVGALALAVAIGAGGSTTDPHGALETMGAQPFGQLLLVFVMVGLAGHALWRLFQALKDPDGEGSDAKGIAKRVGYGIGALVYLGLAFSAGRLAVASSSGGGSEQDWTAWLLSQPLGQVLVAAVGVGIAGYGLSQLYQAYKAQFREYLKLGEMSLREETWITRGGRLGYAARGVVLGLVGLFLIQAAVRFDASEATGLGGALQELLGQPFGPWMLGVVAFGLVAYGLFMIAVARYRRIA